MSALRTHLEGDCWAPCHYCLTEDEMDDVLTEDDAEDEGDTDA